MSKAKNSVKNEPHKMTKFVEWKPKKSRNLKQVNPKWKNAKYEVHFWIDDMIDPKLPTRNF